MGVDDQARETSSSSIVVRRRVEWLDTDAAGHYHHSAVTRWVEYAETVLLDRLGLTDLLGRAPRVRYEVDYTSVLWFNDIIEVELRVATVGRTSVTYEFVVRRAGEIAAQGTMVVVNCDPSVGTPEPWPDATRSAFTMAGPQRPESWGD